jgi:hypothetical protein
MGTAFTMNKQVFMEPGRVFSFVVVIIEILISTIR